MEYDPKNFGALVQLANLCYQHDLLELAVHYMRQAVRERRCSPTTKRRMLSRWEDELQQIRRNASFPAWCAAKRTQSGPCGVSDVIIF